MKPLIRARWVCALGLLSLASAPAHAGWDNVFQVTCFGCRQRPAVSSYAPVTACAPPCTTACAPPCPPPQPVCTTQYVQRSCYQPVTCYQTKTYYEPVTTNRTSFYYEPVTSYRYSCYFDPCTCNYQQVACPTTCYRLRSQTCAVTSYLQRTCQVPVTTYQVSTYYEPVTTCTNPCPTPCPAPCAAPSSTPVAPAVTEQPAIPPTAAPQVQEGFKAAPNGGAYDRYYPQPVAPVAPTAPPPMPPATGANYRQLTPAPVQPRVSPTPAPPTVKLDRIVALPPANNRLQGQVVLDDNRPRAGAQLLFVSEQKQGTQRTVHADHGGNFNAELAPGAWLVYLTGNDGKLAFHSKITVRDEGNRPVQLVSR